MFEFTISRVLAPRICSLKYEPLTSPSVSGLSAYRYSASAPMRASVSRSNEIVASWLLLMSMKNGCSIWKPRRFEKPKRGKRNPL